MGRIKLASNEYALLPEGNYEFTVTNSTYNEQFGKITVTSITDDGKKLVENYQILGNNNTTNDGALRAFSWLARTCMDDEDVEDIDPEDLIGKRFGATIEHQTVESKTEPGKTKTFVKVKERWALSNVIPAPAQTAPADNSSDINLDDILGF